MLMQLDDDLAGTVIGKLITRQEGVETADQAHVLRSAATQE